MKIFLAIVLLIAIIFFVGKIKYNVIFSKNVKALFLNAKDISNKTFSYQQLEGLPPPVQRYLKHVLKEGQPFISSVRLKHDGDFKMGVGKGWTKIFGEQYFRTSPPGFIWLGKTTGVAAKDSYENGKGSLVVTILNMIKVVNGTGKTFDQGELLRWLGESIWFPTNLLPSEKLKWFPIDDTSAKLTFTHNGISLFYIIYFNEKNEIARMESDRFFEGEVMKRWVGECFDYIEVDGIRIPSRITATWKLETGDHTYVDFVIKKIEYNTPVQF
ncbi:MAG: DUF6544 family protein [Saprospiraceae bacterium]